MSPDQADVVKAKIAVQMYRACEKLGADPELLAIIGSYGDTLSDDDVLMFLERYNSGKPLFEGLPSGPDEPGTYRH